MKKIFSILFCAILFCFFMIVPCLAASYPSVDEYIQKDKPHYGYFVYERSGKTYLCEFSNDNEDANYVRLFLAGTDSIRIQYYTDDTLSTYRQLAYTIYKLENGEWIYYTHGMNQTNVGITFNYTEGTVFESTHDIYFMSNNQLGDVFFQVPPKGMTLSEAIQLVVEKEIPATQGIITEQMKTIVLCGIGCLALLISLVLLVRILRRYLPL